MNFKIVLLVIIAGISISSYGVLTNDLALDIQKIDLIILPPMDDPIVGATEFSGVQCSCRDPNPPNEAFGPQFCDVTWITDPAGPDGIKGNEDDVPGVPTPTSLGLNGNMLCTWEASSSDYGDALDYDEGCSANYWLKSSDPKSTDYSWPSGYSPDFMYEDIFQISLVKDDSKDSKIEKLKEKIAKYKAKISELKAEGKIKSQTDRSLIWLLDAIPLNGDGNTIVATKKIESFYDRLDLFTKRGILHHLDKKYILEILENSDDTATQKLTLLDALSNNVLSPPDKQIVKQSVSAILNSAHFQVKYHFSVSEIMLMTQNGIVNDDQIKTANEFKKHNLAGGSLLCSSNED